METIKWVQGVITFVKVAELGSFSKAAMALGVSKSHISKSIASLEEEIGMALFHRSTRKLTLTDSGEHFLSRSKNSLENLEFAKKDMIARSESPRGTLRVTLAGIFGEDYIAPVAMKLIKKYPDLRIELDFNTRIVDLIEEKFDVAIRFGHLQDSSLLAQKIATRQEFVCASKIYLSKHGTPTKLEDLKLHNCLGAKSWSFKKSGKVVQAGISGNLYSNNPRVLLKAALKGIGIVRLPGVYVFEEMKKKRLVPILEDFSLGSTDIWAVTPNRHAQNVNVKVFIDEVRKSLNEGFSDVMF